MFLTGPVFGQDCWRGLPRQGDRSVETRGRIRVTQTSLEVNAGKGPQVEGTACTKAQRPESRWYFPGTVGIWRANWTVRRPEARGGARAGAVNPACECCGALQSLEDSEPERDCPPATAPPPGPLGSTCTGLRPPTSSGHGTLSPAHHVPLRHDQA